MRIEFPKSLKQEVRREQQNKCAICGAANHLSIHHIIPSSLGYQYGLTKDYIRSRDNAVGVCRTPCHDLLDQKALEERKFYPAVLMELGKEYSLQQKRGVM